MPWTGMHFLNWQLCILALRVWSKWKAVSKFQLLTMSAFFLRVLCPGRQSSAMKRGLQNNENCINCAQQKLRATQLLEAWSLPTLLYVFFFVLALSTTVNEEFFSSENFSSFRDFSCNLVSLKVEPYITAVILKILAVILNSVMNVNCWILPKLNSCWNFVDVREFFAACL